MPESTVERAVRASISRRAALKAVFGGGAALLAGPSLLAACSGSGSPSTEKLGDAAGATNGSDAAIAQLRWGNGEFDGLDAATAASNFQAAAAAPAVETLIAFSADLKIIPLLATGYTKPDALHYVYAIRSGVTFWDGTPMTADDVAFSFNRHLDPAVASQQGTFFTHVKSVTVSGSSEVTIELSEPDPQFEYVPALINIYPEAFVKAQGAKLGTPAGSTVTVMGTGPMKIVSYDNTGVRYEASPTYWGEKSRVQKLELLSFNSPDSVRLAYQSGKLDGTFYGISGDTLASWQSVPNARLQSSEPVNCGYLALNTTMAPFDDIHVRRAMAYATDTAGFVKAFLGQAGQEPTSIISPAYFSNLADRSAIDAIYAAIPQYPFDLDKAKAELAQSAHPDGFSIEVPYTDLFPISGQVLVSMAETLKQIGITMRPLAMPIGAWAAKHQANNSPILWGYWLPDFPDPSNIASLFFPSAGAVPHRNNKAHWKVPEVDALLKTQAEATDASARVAALGELLKLAGDQMPYLPLWWERAVMAVDSKSFVYEGFSPLFYDNDWSHNIRATK